MGRENGVVLWHRPLCGGHATPVYRARGSRVPPAGGGPTRHPGSRRFARIWGPRPLALPPAQGRPPEELSGGIEEQGH